MVFLFVGFLAIGLLVPEAAIRKIVQDAGAFGPLLLILFFWTSNFIAPLSGSPFLFVGFYLYGRQVVLYVAVAALMASITNFLVAKKWGRPLVARLAGEAALAKVDSTSLNYGLPALFFFRLFFKEAHDVVSYAFGLTPLNFWHYFVVSTLGMIPPTLVWYFLSAKIHSAVYFTLVSWAMVYLPAGIYLIYRLIKKKRPCKV